MTPLTDREGKDKDKLHFTVGNMRLELKRKVKGTSLES